MRFFSPFFFHFFQLKENSDFCVNFSNRNFDNFKVNLKSGFWPIRLLQD